MTVLCFQYDIQDLSLCENIAASSCNQTSSAESDCGQLPWVGLKQTPCVLSLLACAFQHEAGPPQPSVSIPEELPEEISM